MSVALSIKRDDHNAVRRMDAAAQSKPRVYAALLQPAQDTYAAREQTEHTGEEPSEQQGDDQ
jgi:hypothetical protein